MIQSTSNLRQAAGDPSSQSPLGPRPTLRTLIKRFPKECYEKPTWKGIAYLARDLALYAGAVGLLLSTNFFPLVLLGWAGAALATSGLFVLGHDAAHGSLFQSDRLNRIAARIAMLPSLHPTSVWAYGHNRVHHAFAGCQGLDFVWHPVTPSEYRDMSGARRLLHRIEWSRFGAGIYYAREIWWNRLVRMPAPDRLGESFRFDRAVVTTFFLLTLVATATLGWSQTGTALGAAWMWTKVVLVPWLAWNWIIGWTVYVHHISADTRWYARHEWRKFAGQVETTSNLRVPSFLNVFWHDIFLHIPHHVDPRIPFYNLSTATAVLNRDGVEGSMVKPLAFGDYIRSTRVCKLYDFEARTWISYEQALRASTNEPRVRAAAASTL